MSFLMSPVLTQVFAEAAMFGAVGIGNCDKLFPKMLFPTTCAKSLAEALLHVRRMEEDPTQWTRASQYVNTKKEIKQLTLPRILVPGAVRSVKATHSPPLH